MDSLSRWRQFGCGCRLMRHLTPGVWWGRNGYGQIPSHPHPRLRPWGKQGILSAYKEHIKGLAFYTLGATVTFLGGEFQVFEEEYKVEALDWNAPLNKTEVFSL